LKEMDEYKKMKIFNGKINYDRKCWSNYFWQYCK
jgi:hypothetical protein